MSHTAPTWSFEAERLAHEYLAALTQASIVEQRLVQNEHAAEDSKTTVDATSQEMPHTRVDLAAVAVLTARAVAAESGLAGDLRRSGDVVVVFDTRTPDLVDLVSEVVRKCTVPESSRKLLVVARDGSEKNHIPERGNAAVVEAINVGRSIIGISPSPGAQLPSTLFRTATHRVSLPRLDPMTIKLVLHAVTGTPFEGEIDDDLAAMADLEDLSLSFHRSRTPDQCLARLAILVRGKSQPAESGPTLEELDGYAAARDWGLDLVSDLKDYRAGHLQWEDIANRALLLSGPPGTGKSIFARALARSAGIRVVSTSVAEWNAAAYLNGTLQAIKKAFDSAVAKSPSILLIDEFDGISSRSALSGDYVEYWLQIVNYLLELLSDVSSKEGVIVIATTNYPERIDPALLRAGRIDRHIVIERPDIASLAKIFRYYLGTDLDGTDLVSFASAAFGGTGADVEIWVRRSKAVARRQRRELAVGDLLAEIRGNSGQFSPALRRRIAVHEAGHAITGKYLGIGSVVAVSMLGSGGATQLAERDGDDMDEAALDAMIAFFLAGRAAEALVLGSVGLGSGGSADHNDLARATAMARMAETVHGFGAAAGLVHMPMAETESLARYPSLLDGIRSRLERAFDVATALLSAHRKELEAIARALETHDYLSASDIDKLLLGGVRKPRQSGTAA